MQTSFQHFPLHCLTISCFVRRWNFLLASKFINQALFNIFCSNSLFHCVCVVLGFGLLFVCWLVGSSLCVSGKTEVDWRFLTIPTLFLFLFSLHNSLWCVFMLWLFCPPPIFCCLCFSPGPVLQWMLYFHHLLPFCLCFHDLPLRILCLSDVAFAYFSLG